MSADVKDIIDYFFTVNPLPDLPRPQRPSNGSPQPRDQVPQPSGSPAENPAKVLDTPSEAAKAPDGSTPPTVASVAAEPEKKEAPQVPEAKAATAVATAVATPEQKQEAVPVVVEAKKEEAAEAKKDTPPIPEGPKADVVQPSIPPDPVSHPKEEDEDQVLAESPKEEDKQDEDGEARKPRFVLMEKLLSFLRPSTEVNAVLAGYFAKVLLCFLEKRKLDFLTYIFDFPEHVDNFIKHSYSKSISEIISKILSNEDKFLVDMTGDEFIPERHAILQKMIRKMEPSNSIEEITNNCFILCTLLDTKQQLGFFLKEEVLKSIFDIALSPHPMSLRAGLTFFITLNRLRSTPGPGINEQFNLLGTNQPTGRSAVFLLQIPRKRMRSTSPSSSSWS